MSIMGESKSKKDKWTRAEAEFVLKLRQKGASTSKIHARLRDAEISKTERTLNAVNYLIHTVLRPMRTMDEFEKHFPIEEENELDAA